MNVAFALLIFVATFVLLIYFARRSMLRGTASAPDDRGSAPTEPWTHVTFQADASLVSPEERRDAEDEGPAVLGAGILRACRAAVAGSGLEIEEPYPEDYGASADAFLGAAGFVLTCGFVGDTPEEWLLIVEPRRGSAKASLPEALTAFDRVLRTLPVREVRWHAKEHWKVGRGAQWREHPVA